MKKIIAILMIVILLAVTLMGFMGVAFAAEPIGIKITPVDYQTGKAVNKAYVENELFRLKVTLDIPRFVDLSNMQMVVEIDGVEVVGPEIKMETGTYYIDGVVKTQPASVTVKIKDMAFDTAETAEEMYYAMQNDRTVSATYNFSNAVATGGDLYIPKTGDMSVIYPAVAFVGAAVIMFRKRK